MPWCRPFLLISVLLQSDPDIMFAGFPELLLIHQRCQPVRALRLTLFVKNNLDGVEDSVDHSSPKSR